MTFNVLKKLAEEKSNKIPPQEQPDWARSEARSISDFLNITVPKLNALEAKIKALPDLEGLDGHGDYRRLSKESLLRRIRDMKQTGAEYSNLSYPGTYVARLVTNLQYDFEERLKTQSADLGYKPILVPDRQLAPLSEDQKAKVYDAIAQAMKNNLGTLTDHDGNEHSIEEVMSYRMQQATLDSSPGYILDPTGPEDAELETAVVQIKIGLKAGEPYVAEPEYNEVIYDFIHDSYGFGRAHWVTDIQMTGRGAIVPIPLALVDVLNEIIYVDPKALGKLPNPTQVTMGSFISFNKIANMLEQGLSAGMSVEDIAEKHNVDVSVIEEQLQMGIKVEKEHTDDENVARKIALDHLTEDPKYYSHLKEMEEKYTGAAHG